MENVEQLSPTPDKSIMVISPFGNDADTYQKADIIHDQIVYLMKNHEKSAEAKCGADKKAADGKCGATKKAADGKPSPTPDKSIMVISPFGNDADTYQKADIIHDQIVDKKAADGKCGATKKAADGKCGADKKVADGKCGANYKITP
jgi:uncharacterized low-complexity protein